jgi:SAM-dependent methyltransferase
MDREVIIPAMSTEEIVVPESVREMAEQSVGIFFEGVTRTSRDANARDHLDVVRPIRKGELLERFVPLRGKKLLEIGSGFGTNLGTWMRKYALDGYGTERDTEGFGSSFKASRELFGANGLDPERIVLVADDTLPFPNGSFDVVYSGNVLEHTESPMTVLEEAVRVLRPGGILHVEVPNYLSYFEGHYLIPQPPLVWRWVLPAWVRLLGRDPAFAYTMRTEINPIWCRRAIKQISKKYPVTLLSLGAEVFLDRLTQPFEFEMERTAAKLSRFLRILQRVNVCNWIGRSIVLAQAHYPIYLTVRREGAWAGVNPVGKFMP